jgi:hypothetical protein
VYEKYGFREWGSCLLYLLLDAPDEVGVGSGAVNEADLIETGVESIGDTAWVRVEWLNLAFGHDLSKLFCVRASASSIRRDSELVHSKAVDG